MKDRRCCCGCFTAKISKKIALDYNMSNLWLLIHIYFLVDFLVVLDLVVFLVVLLVVEVLFFGADFVAGFLVVEEVDFLAAGLEAVVDFFVDFLAAGFAEEVDFLVVFFGAVKVAWQDWHSRSFLNGSDDIFNIEKMIHKGLS